ncbi:hypothetical protein JZO70_07635 [Enterococcus sp. 669A]|uniref:BAAT/Acyl-CoA thioester hydrolase C-terminal domain-containing protein n=1 Tax=Candidatus Enterococcus moelleringii TaxID=2815325 RepID=A0ABS3L8R9_9ENTE|nr:acyl-CoA thioester hydrolase/BAAT C-terminal domain-containing protein [Enterococcus sp. 669A]MBO1306027.1 hypothetical protein [Enterococcus sp. 669A]
MERMEVEKDGFHGYYHPASMPHDRDLAVVVVGGSEGNDNVPLQMGQHFAKHGITALGVCYWNVPGLPDNLVEVPLEPFESAIQYLHEKGHSKIAMYGISKGAELALLCATKLHDISKVVAVSPSHCVWGGITEKMLSKKFTAVSEFTWRGKGFPCMVGELSYGRAIWNLLTQQQINLAYMYANPLRKFDEATAIPVEEIEGDLLFIYAKHDTMWPSMASVQYMMKRLKERNWKHQVTEFGYEKASHIITPLNPPSLKMFKVERKYPDACNQSRQDAFEKTLSWLKA